MNICRTCARQDDCASRNIHVNDCLDWVNNEQERDLAIWWEAYLQLLTSVARNGEKLNVIADYALADYRAKREEMLNA